MFNLEGFLHIQFSFMPDTVLKIFSLKIFLYDADPTSVLNTTH